MFRIKLKEIRESKNISQYKLAKDLHLSQSTIGNWEAGKREPNFNTLNLIADYFDVSTDYLLGREDFRKQPNLLSKRPEYLLSEKFASEYADLLKDKHFIDTAKLYNAITPEYRALCLGYIAGLLQKHGIDTGRILGY